MTCRNLLRLIPRLGVLLTTLALASCLGGPGPEAPTITDQPKDKAVFVSQTANFDIGVTGKPPFTFQWYRNGVVIDGATAATYTTPILTSADSGAKFSVKISTPSGSVTSSQAVLTVKDKPTVTTDPVSTSVAVGASVSLTVAGSGDSLTYQWLRDELPITGATSATYTFTAVAADDGAVFRAYVVNPGGYAVSAPATVTVNDVPAFAIQPFSQTVGSGDPVAFTVLATGGNLSYQWLRNGVNIAGATSRSYSIAAVTAADNGASFSVKIANAQGSATSAVANLSVVAAAVRAVATPVAEVALSKNATAAYNFTYVRKSDGSIASFGYNSEGERGDGTVAAASDTAGTVTLPAGRKARQVDAGSTHGIALLDNGDVYSWGLNDGGQLGLGDTVTRSTPAKISLPRPAVSVAAGRSFSVAVLNDGSVYTFGANDIGQLGNGGRDVSTTPVLVAGVNNVVAVAAGNAHVLALRGDGSVWAWGANASGQLGNGSFKASRVPVDTGLRQIARVRAGGDNSAAISLRRTAYFFGENADGQLGFGSAVTTDAGVATAVALDIVDAALADRFAMLVGSNGLVTATGANEAGSLGDGGTTARSNFAAVSVISNVISIGAGGRSFAAAINADGTTYTWGDNSAKQLGNSTLTTTGTATPTAIPSFDAVP